MESQLVHGEGDLEGEPYRLAPHLLRLTYRWFEYQCRTDGCSGHDGDGHQADHPVHYLHDVGVVGYPKGSAKTEWEEALALEHLEGPSHTYGTPLVAVAAVDGDQADELVRRAATMIPAGTALAERLRVDTGRIVHRRGAGSGRILSTKAAIGKNDGKLTSLQINDELHEWDGIGTMAGAKRHGVLARAKNKRTNSRQINVSTAGWSLETLLGGMYRKGLAVAAGELVDPRFLFEWWEAAEDWNLDDADQLTAAIVEANPMVAVLDDLVERLVASYHEHKLINKVDEFCRYHLNRWMPLLEGQWIDMEAWAARAAPNRPVRDGTRVVLGFDGSETGDATAIVGATVERAPHVFVVGLWEAPEVNDGSWRVPVNDVKERLVRACTHRLGGWDVTEVAADVSYWRGPLEDLAAKGLPIVSFSQKADFTEACERAYQAVTRAEMTHDGSPDLTRHVSNARRKPVGDQAVRITKEHNRSKKWIDLAAAMCMAIARAQQLFYEQGATELEGSLMA